MFRNKTYLGIRKCGDLEIENAHGPLVSREAWDAVQATLRERPQKGGAGRRANSIPCGPGRPFCCRDWPSVPNAARRWSAARTT